MEKIIEDSNEYTNIVRDYNIVMSDISRDKKYNISSSSKNNKFIGGLPITLEQKDIFTLMKKSSNSEYLYTATQKVDGTRFLMFVNKFTDGERNITFIDRNNNLFVPKNVSRDNLPIFTTMTNPEERGDPWQEA